MNNIAKHSFNKQEDITITAIIYVFIAWFSISALTESLLNVMDNLLGINIIENIDVKFLMYGTGKFLLVFLIFFIVINLEKNNISTLGFTKARISDVILHSAILYTLITGIFMLIFFITNNTGINLSIGFMSLRTFISSYAFWFFILSSAISEEVLFRGFLIKRVTWLVKNEFVSVVLISAFYGYLHLSLWGYIGLIGFGIWGFVIGLYFVYVKENLYPLMIAHFFSDLTLFVIITQLV